MKKILGLSVIILLILRGYVFAELSQCNFVKENVTVVFVNGVTGSRSQAIDSMDRIDAVIFEMLSADQYSKFKFELAYNKSYSLIKDLWESLNQKALSENPIASFFRWLSGNKIMPEFIRQDFISLSAKFDFSSSVGIDDLDEHLTLYKNNLLEGRTVILISHSQGNFFANAAYQKIVESGIVFDPNKLKIISVANPSSFVSGNGQYITSEEDLVIRATRITAVSLVQVPLLPNITNIGSGAETSDPIGHSFMEEYMAKGIAPAFQIPTFSTF